MIADIAGAAPCSEMGEAAKRHSQQQELLNTRISELDVEGRKLRDQKYQLDTQVGICWGLPRIGQLENAGHMHTCQAPDVVRLLVIANTRYMAFGNVYHRQQTALLVIDKCT